MEDYNKIIESLGVKFIKARNIRILQPIRIKNYYDVENSLLILYKGEVSFGEEETQVEEGDMLFIPGGKMVSVTYGNAEKPKAVNNEEFMTHRELYFDQNNDSSAIGRLENSFGMVAFEAKVFDSVNFFTSLDIPPFLIKKDEKNFPRVEPIEDYAGIIETNTQFEIHRIYVPTSVDEKGRYIPTLVQAALKHSEI